jgi:predicted nucleic acid-binding protein
MRTAVDTSVLLDVLTADATFGPASREALRRAIDQGALVASDVVWAEVRAHFKKDEPFLAALSMLGVQFDPLTREAATLAGALWQTQRRAARRSGAADRPRVMADFLVGAHARLQAERLLARDRGYFRSYFKDLTVIDPAS